MGLPSPPQGFSIRRYSPADWANYFELDVRTRSELPGMPSAESIEELRKIRNKRLECAYGFTPAHPPAYPPHQIFVVEKDGRYVGHLWVTDRVDPLTDEQTLCVTSVAIEAPFRRIGLARYLISVAETLAKTREVRKVILQVAAVNGPAKKLFYALGYEVESFGYQRKLPEPQPGPNH